MEFVVIFLLDKYLARRDEALTGGKTSKNLPRNTSSEVTKPSREVKRARIFRGIPRQKGWSLRRR
jgi:hypothetical protein